MTHIRTVLDLFEWVEEHAPTEAAARLVREGHATNLGGFRLEIGLSYIVEIKGEEKTWYVAATLWEDQVWRVSYLMEVPWQHYIGLGSEPSLVNGDVPGVAAIRRARAKREADNARPSGM